MTPEQTEIRNKEIALAKWLGYSVLAVSRPSANPYKPMQKNTMYQRVDRLGKAAHEGYYYIEDAAWPRFATDESLLSTLMKGLAGKGLTPTVTFGEVWA